MSMWKDCTTCNLWVTIICEMAHWHHLQCLQIDFVKHAPGWHFCLLVKCLDSYSMDIHEMCSPLTSPQKLSRVIAAKTGIIISSLKRVIICVIWKWIYSWFLETIYYKLSCQAREVCHSLLHHMRTVLSWRLSQVNSFHHLSVSLHSDLHTPNTHTQAAGANVSSLWSSEKCR